MATQNSSFSLPFRLKLINFNKKKHFKELAYIMKMLLMKESVLNFEEKTTQPWFTYLLTNVLRLLDNFSIRLLGYRTEFSCLYLSQGHNFISFVWLLSTDELLIF